MDNGRTEALIAVGAFALQTLSVFAFNSLVFGLVKPGEGMYTNLEMATRHTSLVTPARWAFAIWGAIYVWECVAMAFIFFTPNKVPGWRLGLWAMANAFQGLWAPIFATEHLTASALALSGIAISLVLLGTSMRDATGWAYWLCAAPIWLHAGWVCAASLVNINLSFASNGGSASAQLALASLSSSFAFMLGLSIVWFGSAETSYAPLPLAASLCWALSAIRAELIAPDLIARDRAYEAIGEVGRESLEMSLRALVIGLAIGSAAIVLLRSYPRGLALQAQECM